MKLMSGPPLSVFRIVHLPLPGSLVLAEALLPLSSLPRLLPVPRLLYQFLSLSLLPHPCFHPHHCQHVESAFLYPKQCSSKLTCIYLLSLHKLLRGGFYCHPHWIGDQNGAQGQPGLAVVESGYKTRRPGCRPCLGSLAAVPSSM